MDGMMEKVLYDKELIKEFINDCKIRGLTKETIRCYEGQIKIFYSFLKNNNRNLLDADKEDLKQFILYLREERKVSIKRIENYFSSLSTFYEFLIYQNIASRNPVLEVRKRYIWRYKKNYNNGNNQRKLISVEEMANFINSILDIRDKAMALLLAKTGIRRGELIRIDLEDIDWEDMSILLKPTPKRSNRVVFFDPECAIVLKKWLKRRELVADPQCKALFVGYIDGKRLKRNGVYTSITRWAEKAGLHDKTSDKLKDHFSPHCFRHWFTTHLRRAGMPREFIQELRGDVRSEAMDIYYHIDREELKKSYLACIPKLGVE